MSKITEVGNIADNLTSTREEDEDSRDKRHEIDSLSESWWAKFVRPFALIYLLLAYSAIGFFDIEVKDEFHSTIKNWGDLAFMFYFSSRGIEKVARIANKQIRFMVRDKRKERRENRRNK
jgi:hypothetical protein